MNVEVLLNYGVLGAWTGWLLLQQNYHQKEMKTIIKSNTEALILVKTTIGKCVKTNKRAG